MDIGIGLLATPTLAICCYLHPPSVTAHFRHTHTHKIKGEGTSKSSLSVGGRIRSCVGDTLPSGPGSFRLSLCLFLPPSLGENNYGTSAAFEGWLDGTDSYNLGGVSGQLGVSPQLVKQLSVEGGRLGLSCYLSSQGPRGRVGLGELISITHATTTAHHTTGSDRQMRS